MAESEAQVDAHNRRDAWNEIQSRVEAAAHELGLALDAIDDLPGAAPSPKFLATLQNTCGRVEGLVDAVKQARD